MPPAPVDLREQLFDAVAANDLSRVEALCRAHRDEIVAAFPSWQRVPTELRSQPAALQRYANGLITTARTFAERLGSPELMARLSGGDDNPISRWQSELAAAQKAISELRYTEAVRVLERGLEAARSLRGTGVDQLQPIALGYLGECLFQQGQVAKAIDAFEQALAVVKRTGDGEGIAAYLGNLYEANRYAGRAVEAAGYARARGAVAAPPEQAGWNQRADRARAGEPLNRVVAVLDGTRYELEALPPVTARVQFVFERNRVTLRPATVLTGRGEQAGAAGRYDEAERLFADAAKADAFDPHSRYQRAFTLLHLRRYAEAAALYAETEALAPGWFNCRQDLWLAQELAAARVTHHTFTILSELEDGRAAPAEKLALADRALAAAPSLAKLHLIRGKAWLRLQRVDEARAAFARGLTEAREPDMRTCLLTQLGATASDASTRAAYFSEAVQLGGNLVAAAGARLALRAEAN